MTADGWRESSRPADLHMPSYEVGYRDGGNSANADWWIEIVEVLGEDFDVTPANVANLLRRSQEMLVCNSTGIDHKAHVWDFLDDRQPPRYWCPGWPRDEVVE